MLPDPQAVLELAWTIGFVSHFAVGYALTPVDETLQLRLAGEMRPACPDRPDAALVADTLHGQPATYEGLVRRYERSVRATCFAILKDWHAAQDAAQETFLRAYVHLGSLRDGSRFGPWILTIAHRAAMNMEPAH